MHTQSAPTRQVPIAIGKGNKGKARNTVVRWAKFTHKFRSAKVSEETMAEYLSLPFDKKLAIKNLDGFYLPARMKGGSRKRDAVRERAILTLDLDNDTGGKVLKSLTGGTSSLSDVEWFLHTTKSHVSKTDPRYRLVVLLDRDIQPEEHGPLSRIVGGMLDIEAVDPVSHRPAQVCFFPVRSFDQEYLFHHNHGQMLSPDEVFEEWELLHADRFDVEHLPRGSSEKPLHAEERRAQWPLDKPGIVGDWCRAYGDIHRVIEEHLSDIYLPTSDPDRYTHVNSSGAPGIVIYEDQFLYSHHASDPCAGQLCNAWDVVRLCKFASKDKKALEENPSANGPDLPSYRAMQAFAANDDRLKAYKARKLRETMEQFSYEDAQEGPQEPQDARVDEDDPLAEIDEDASHGQGAARETAPNVDVLDDDAPDIDWMELLDRHPKTAELLPSPRNLHLILHNDHRLKGVFGRNSNTGFDVFVKDFRTRLKLPFNDISIRLEPEERLMGKEFHDHHYYAIHEMLLAPSEFGGYGIQFPVGTVMQMVDSLFGENPFNPVMNWALSLPEWDGKERAENLFVDYLEVENKEYARTVARLVLYEAMSRALRPGSVADHMPILYSAQGSGKTTFIRTLAGADPWGDNPKEGLYCDLSVSYVEPKLVYERIGSAWIIEMSELASFDRTSNEHMKSFLSACEDSFRAAYARKRETHQRWFVVWGTTNDDKFLRDPTGNRRYLPLKVNERFHMGGDKIDIHRLIEERDQIWAEVREWVRTWDSRPAIKGKDWEIVEEVRAENTVPSRIVVLAEQIDEIFTDIPVTELVAGTDFGDDSDRRVTPNYLTAKMVYEKVFPNPSIDEYTRVSTLIGRALRKSWWSDMVQVRTNYGRERRFYIPGKYPEHADMIPPIGEADGGSDVDDAICRSDNIVEV